MREEQNSSDVQVSAPIEAERFAEQEDQILAVGAHVITSRRGYHHHGIYVGDGNVVHYSGWTRGWHRGPVEEISLAAFTSGAVVWVRRRARHHFDPREIARRARSRVGENHYRVLSNNCEHFCEWCVHGEPRSYQVEALLSFPARVLNLALRFIAERIGLAMTTKSTSSLTVTRAKQSFDQGVVARAWE